MRSHGDRQRHTGLEIAAIVLLLLSAMLEPMLTVGIAAALIAGVLVMGLLGHQRSR
jgi:hypothetical protein